MGYLLIKKRSSYSNKNMVGVYNFKIRHKTGTFITLLFFFISYHYVDLDTEGGRSLDPIWFMVINFP
jgi:hypothetical protein